MADLLICPHCGHVIDTSDPRLSNLPESTVRLWDRIQRPLKHGERLGSSRVGRLGHMSPQAAQRHLRRLTGAGLLVAQPKRKGGVYHVYALNA